MGELVRAVKVPPQTNGGRVARLGREDRAELFDRRLERDVLGAFVIFPDLILSSGVVDSDFAASAHRTTFRALLRLAAEGETIDTNALRGALTDAGAFAAVGGEDYLQSLTDGIPSRDVNTLRLRKLARKRRLYDAAAMVVAKAGSEELDHYLRALDAARADLAAVSSTRLAIPMLADCIPSIRQIGPRLPLGLPSLDGATRGGLPLGKLVALIGAPGASKTNFATWLASGWERAGCAVLFVAADESREAVITRFGQLAGFDRDNLEGEDDGRRNAFRRDALTRSIAVVDPFEDRVSLEMAERMLIELAGDRPRVLIVDSLQTAPCDASLNYETRREQVEAKIDVLKGIHKRGALVLLISEMARAGYRTGRRDQDISALAAGAESRAVEYAAHLLLGLKPVRGEIGQIDVEVAKNRLGQGKPEIRLSLNFETLGFRELDKPADDEADREAERYQKTRARLIATVARHRDLRTATQVVRAAGARKAEGGQILRELVAEGALVMVDGFYRVGGTGGGDPCKSD